MKGIEGWIWLTLLLLLIIDLCACTKMKIRLECHQYIANKSFYEVNQCVSITLDFGIEHYKPYMTLSLTISLLIYIYIYITASLKSARYHKFFLT